MYGAAIACTVPLATRAGEVSPHHLQAVVRIEGLWRPDTIAPGSDSTFLFTAITSYRGNKRPSCEEYLSSSIASLEYQQLGTLIACKLLLMTLDADQQQSGNLADREKADVVVAIAWCKRVCAIAFNNGWQNCQKTFHSRTAAA